ncbi:RNA ligase family protein [Candidatus Harpocratesius sp.]
MRKYIEIEPIYRKKYIESFIRKYPELKNEEFILTEKIDGTNVRLCFTIDGRLVLGSRNQILDEGKDHFGLKEVIKQPEYQNLIAFLKEKVFEYKKEIMLVGELFGKGINNRIEYGEKRINFFDIYVDDKLQPQKVFFEILQRFPELCVPILERIHGLQKAIDYPALFVSKISNDFAEGLVIKPFSKIYRRGGIIFYLKNKNPEFEERPSKSKKTNRAPNPLLEYISQNRVIDMFSKIGVITSKQDIGKYVKLIREDALLDFEKDNPDFKIEKKHLKGVNGKISKILLKFI